MSASSRPKRQSFSALYSHQDPTVRTAIEMSWNDIIDMSTACHVQPFRHVPIAEAATLARCPDISHGCYRHLQEILRIAVSQMGRQQYTGYK